MGTYNALDLATLIDMSENMFKDEVLINPKYPPTEVLHAQLLLTIVKQNEIVIQLLSELVNPRETNQKKGKEEFLEDLHRAGAITEAMKTDLKTQDWEKNV